MVMHEAEDLIEFRVYLPHARTVELIGDFTHWDEGAKPLTPVDGECEGWWGIRCRIPNGDHAFTYLVDGQYWMPDYAACGVKRDPSGRWISTLSISDRGLNRERRRPGDDAGSGRARAARDWSERPGSPASVSTS